MKHKRSYWFLGVVAVLLLSLLVNQWVYVYTAATEQESYFNSKAQLALDSIVNKVSEDYKVCQSVKQSFGPSISSMCQVSSVVPCSRDFQSQEEWHSVDSIIRSELQSANIDLKYKFDFCNNLSKAYSNVNNYTYTKELDKTLSKSGIVMHLEFPSRSNYILKQISPAFMSSILIIVLIGVVIGFLFRYYKKEQRNAEKTRDFLNNMTHEFKTPLANIAFANNVLNRKSEDISPEKIRQYTQIIAIENRKIIDSSEDILELAKQEYDFVKLELETIDVHDVIYELQKSIQATNTASSVSIRSHLGAEVYDVLGKTSFLQNALSNVLDNAIKFCAHTPEIYIRTYNEKNQICIEIKDNGIGIPKSELHSIFDKFYRVSTGDLHNVKGFGLGLSYVKMVVTQMDGTITVKSHATEGTTFTIKLPVAHEQ